MHIRKAFRPLLCAGLCAVLPYTQAQAKEPALHLTAASTYYDNRSTALDLVQSYYNAIGTGHALSVTPLKALPKKMRTSLPLITMRFATNSRISAALTCASNWDSPALVSVQRSRRCPSL